MESGRRWKDEDIPKTQWDLPHFVWFPAAECYGVQRIEYLDDVLGVACLIGFIVLAFGAIIVPALDEHATTR